MGTAIGASGATSVHFTGSIGGEVKNAAGVAQMGATIILYNRYDRAIRQVLSNPDGSFLFDGLIPDLYSLRVSLANFVPAFKRNISVQPGFHSVLAINLASLLSSIEFVSSPPAKGSLMSDDWKWVLRSSESTRPVLRFGDPGLGLPSENHPKMSVFSETRGIVRVSAGDATSMADYSAQPDLGTAFAVATSLFGSNQLELSGNFGYSSHTGLPVAGFRTKYKRGESENSPEITVTMHQVALPVRGGFGPAAGQDGPSLRTLSMTSLQELSIADNVHLEYGASAETVSLWNRLNMVSPFARLTYDLGTFGSVQVAYSSGAPATELAAHTADAGMAREDNNVVLNDNLSALGFMPRVSVRDQNARVQRTENAEIGYTKVSGRRTYSAGVYHERVSNGVMTLAGSGDLYAGDVLPDLGSDSSVLNIGSFSRWGYLASATQQIGDRLEFAVSYGRSGMLTTEGRVLKTEDINELRRVIQVHDGNWATAQVSGTLPVTGTNISTSYGWTEYSSLMPSHLFLTQQYSPQPGFNIIVRQPLPAVGGVPGRFEATAELRNLLQQNYLGLIRPGGQMMVLTNAPRAVRGGLSFIF